MPVEMQLLRIIISEILEEQYILLREVNGPRQLTIVIGLYEATSIDRGVRGVQPPRPATHDLLISAIKQLDGELDSVVINELFEGTYYALLRVRRDGQLLNIDARPSDAIALAVRCDPPLQIFVAEDLLTNPTNESP